MGTTYSGIRKAQKMKTAEKNNAYKNGGAVAKKPSTVINITMQPARGQGASEASAIAPAGLNPPPSRSAAPPVPPVAAEAGLAAMGARPPMFANGGKVAAKTPSSTAAMTKRIAKPTGTRGNIVDAGGSGSKRKVHGGKQPSGAKMYADGGKVSMDAGAGGGKGRLEKVKDYGKKGPK